MGYRLAGGRGVNKEKEGQNMAEEDRSRQVRWETWRQKERKVNGTAMR